MGSQQFCLKWSNHHSNIVSVFEDLLSSEALVDVTLACEGLSLKAHKMVLSACSPFFQSLFIENPCKHPIVIMKDIKYSDLKAIIDFMYRGEVNISHDQMSAFLKTAETLRVKGLAMLPDDSQQDNSSVNNQGSTKSIEPSSYGTSFTKQAQQRKIRSPPPRRKRRTSQSSESSIDKTEEHTPAKIKERDSPEIIEEFSRDSGSDHFTSTHQRGTSSATSHSSAVTETMTVAVSQCSIQRTQMSTSEGSQPVQTVSLTDNTYEREAAVESRVPPPHDSESISPFSLPVASQALLPVTGSSESLTHFSGSGPSSSEEQLVLPTSVPAEPSISSHDNDSMCIDIKPTLMTYGEPSVSGEAGPSHLQDSSSTLLFRNPLDALAETSSSQSIHQDTQYQSEQQASQGSITRYFISPKVQDASRSRIFKEKPRCVLCNRQFFSKQCLQRHLDCHKTNRKIYSCNICGRTFSHITNLYQHRTLHEEVFRYKCTVCSKTFVYQAALQRHLLEKHASDTSLN